MERVSIESSVNPRFLLAFIEQRSGWIYSLPVSSTQYPNGFHIGGYSGLYRELVMTATHLNMGYYGWRDGTHVEIKQNNKGGGKVIIDYSNHEQLDEILGRFKRN